MSEEKSRTAKPELKPGLPEKNVSKSFFPLSLFTGFFLVVVFPFFNSFSSGFLTFISCYFSFSGLEAKEVLEVPSSPEDTNRRILEILSKVDPEGFRENEKTHGFIYRYDDRWFSAFDYNVYIGKMNQRSPDSIIRIESGDRGQERVWKQVFEAELLRNPPQEDMRKLERKSYLYSQTLNLVQPSFSVMYNSWNSPFFTGSDTFWASTFYIVTDLVLAGSAYLYAQNKAPRKTIWDNLLNRRGPPPVMQGPDAGAVWGALAVTRVYRMFGSVQDTRAHNRMVELEYSFRF